MIQKVHNIRGLFFGASSLTSIAILSSVTSIGDGAFSGASLVTIYAEVYSHPSWWHNNWNPSNQKFHWCLKQYKNLTKTQNCKTTYHSTHL